jgi:hypothetical protein
MRTHPHVVLEHVCCTLDGQHVVHDELAEGCEEVTALVKLLDLLVLVHVVCNTGKLFTLRKLFSI